VLASNATILSRGIALYTLQQGSGLISNVTECHEHPVKLSYSQLLLVRPLVAGLAGPLPAVLPAVQEVSRWAMLCAASAVWILMQLLLRPLVLPCLLVAGVTCLQCCQLCRMLQVGHCSANTVVATTSSAAAAGWARRAAGSCAGGQQVGCVVGSSRL
jgi:hypothetical protein